MEKPTTGEVGSEDLEAEPASPTVGRSKDAHDFLRTGGADAGVGVDVDVDAGAGASAGAAEEETASGGVSTVVSSDAGGSGTSERVDSWVTIEATMPATGSHDSDMDFT
jgi:hypothetical protein